MDQANQSPFGEKSTLHVSHPARPSKDGGRLVFSSKRRVGSEAERRTGNKNALKSFKCTHPPLQSPFQSSPPGCFDPDQHAHVAGGSAFFSVEHIAFTCSSSRSGPGSVAVHEQRGSDSCSGGAAEVLNVRFLEPDAPWTIGSSVPVPTVVTFLSLRNHIATGHAP